VIAEGSDFDLARVGVSIKQIEERAEWELREMVREEKTQDSRAVLQCVGECHVERDWLLLIVRP